MNNCRKALRLLTVFGNMVLLIELEAELLEGSGVWSAIAMPA